MTLYEYLESVLSKHNKKISDISNFSGLGANFNYWDFLKSTDYIGNTGHDCNYNDDFDLIDLRLWIKNDNILNWFMVHINPKKDVQKKRSEKR